MDLKISFIFTESQLICRQYLRNNTNQLLRILQMLAQRQPESLAGAAEPVSELVMGAAGELRSLLSR